MFAGCLKSCGINFFTGVPDSLLKSFCVYVMDTCGENFIIAANEGLAVGLMAEHFEISRMPSYMGCRLLVF